MEFEQLKKNWDAFGKIDPLWAILTNPQKRNNKWDVSDFFKTGEEEISRVIKYIDSLNIPLARKRALDFGCGVGRLTQALCQYFEESCGIDIAPSMIELAEQYNRYGSKCHYYLNDAQDLKLFEDNSFDFIYSNIVLQHMKTEYSKNYIKEFLRILAVDGLLVFQLPSPRADIQTDEYGLPKDQDILNQLSKPISANLTSVKTTTKEALSDSAFKAEILLQEPLTVAKTGEQITINLTVKNSSNITWPAKGTIDGKYQINLGNHWLNSAKEMLVEDDARVSIPKDVQPMEEVNITLTITAPLKPGTYWLELDMVQEMVAWFKNKGSKTIQVCVQVEASDLQASSDSELIVPKMEMYGLSQDVVSDVLVNNGGQIIDIKENDCLGSGLLSISYCVKKINF